MRSIRISFILLTVLAIGCTSSSTGAPSLPSIDTGIDPNQWVKIPAGEFLMGQHNHETLVEYNYEIMVTDVTNLQYAEYLNQAVAQGDVRIDGGAVVGYYPGDIFHEGRHEEEIPEGYYLHVPLDDPGLRLSYDQQTFSVVPGYENHPVVLVSWFGAKAFCESIPGGRLPTEVEWEKAARGSSDDRPFPWGEDIQRSNANYYSSHDIFEKVAGAGGNTTPVGFYNGGTYEDYQTIDSPSPYGLYDMAGNVWQWMGDVYEGQHYRYMRGGSKDNYGYNLRIWTRNNAHPEYYSPGVGFRCVTTD